MGVKSKLRGKFAPRCPRGALVAPRLRRGLRWHEGRGPTPRPTATPRGKHHRRRREVRAGRRAPAAEGVLVSVTLGLCPRVVSVLNFEAQRSRQAFMLWHAAHAINS